MISNHKRDSLLPGTTRERQLVPILGLSVGLATVTVFLTASIEGVSVGTVLLETGWVFLISILAALALYRFSLSYCDHRIQYSGAKGINLLHDWFMHREARVDHVAIPLTIGALLYSVVFGIFLACRFIDAAIRAIVSLLTL